MKLGKYDLFLLDFDGLLVDTESIHYKAYCLMLNSFGLSMPWDLTQYCQIAHISSEFFQKSLFSAYPKLQTYDWSTLYEKKKAYYLELINKNAIQLMPGVEKFLKILKENNLNHAVVTHSPKVQIDCIRKKTPELQTIPHWLTRENYKNPKPHPDSYLTAIKQLGGKAPIGFEDSLRGFNALKAANVTPVLIRPTYYPPIDEPFYSSFDDYLTHIS